MKLGEITLRTEIWWHDVVYHEADHCMKWPDSADFRIFFYLGRPSVLSFSERLVHTYLEKVMKLLPFVAITVSTVAISTMFKSRMILIPINHVAIYFQIDKSKE